MNPGQVRKLGLAPVQRDDFEYEFMLVMDCDKETHNATIIKDNTFLDAQGFYGKITPELGRQLREWMNNGVEPTEWALDVKNSLDSANTIDFKLLNDILMEKYKALDSNFLSKLNKHREKQYFLASSESFNFITKDYADEQMSACFMDAKTLN